MSDPKIARHVAGRALSVRSAAIAIAFITLLVTLVGALLAWLLDRDEFGSLGTAMWWAAQTVTTVGYGDVTPMDTVGRTIGVVVMLAGIGFVTVLTAAITATFIETARRRMSVADPDPLAEILARLERIERRLDEL